MINFSLDIEKKKIKIINKVLPTNKKKLVINENNSFFLITLDKKISSLFNKKKKTNIKVLIKKIIDNQDCDFLFLYIKETNEIFFFCSPLLFTDLYFFKKKNFYFFSSSIKNLITNKNHSFNPNIEAMKEFIVHGEVTGSRTFIKEISKFNVGFINILLDLKLKNYFGKLCPKLNKKKLNYKDKKTQNKLLYLLNSSIANNLNFRYKFGYLLSGGIDSGLLTALSKNKGYNLKSFTSYTNSLNISYDERKLSKLVIKKYNLDHKFIKLNYSNNIENIKKVIEIIESPLKDLNILTFFEILKSIKKENIRHIVTGEGSDEIFGGYDRHHSMLKKKGSFKQNVMLANNIINVNKLKKYFGINYKIAETRTQIFKQLKNLPKLQKILCMDRMTYLRGLLNNFHKIADHNKLTLSTPFLQKKIINQAVNLDYKSSFNFNYKKFFLRKIAEKFLPKEIVWNLDKYQFNFNADSFFKSLIFKKIIKNFFKKGFLCEKFLKIHKKGFRKILYEHNNNVNHENIITRIFTLEIYLNQYFNYNKSKK